MFNRQWLLVFLSFLLTSIVSGQKKDDFEEGYIVLMEKGNTPGDTISGLIADRKETITNTEFLPKMVLRNMDFRKKRKYHRSELYAFQRAGISYINLPLVSSPKISFLDNYYLIDWRAKQDDWLSLRIISQGKINHYRYEWSDQGTHLIQEMSLLHIPGLQEMARVDLGLLGFKKKVILQYLSGCPAVVSELGGIKIKSVNQIISRYEALCDGF